MDYYESLGSTAANDLGNKIVKFYQKFNDSISITDYRVNEDRVIFLLKLKGATRKAHLYAHAPDVQQRLKLPMFQLMEHKYNLYLIVSEHKITYPHLDDLLQLPHFQKHLSQYTLPYVVGHNPIGDLITADLTACNHLLIGGSSNSGKTVHLQALITSLAYTRTPAQVNFVMIDAGASDLLAFRHLPHLSCPIISNRNKARRVLAALTTELNSRKKLKLNDPDKFSTLPHIILVIDEFPALFDGADKETTSFLTETISTFLRRGRHAKIHVVIAAQNPTLKNMRVDLANITARVAFQCAKRNFSETILGASGAEDLLGDGDLLFNHPKYKGLQRAQGVYVDDKNLPKSIFEARQSSNIYQVPAALLALQPPQSSKQSSSSLQPLPRKTAVEDRQFAEIMLWALSRNSISTNALMAEHRMGWNKASRTVQRLEELGIVEPLDGKQARHVVPTTFDDLTENTLTFLHQNGVDDDRLIKGISSR